MANSEHLAILNQGVKAWDKWREENRDIVPDLSEVDLVEADLWYNDKGINLSGADLKKANLRVADRTSADLTNVDLKKADLQRVDLSEANLKAVDLRGTDLSRAFLLRNNLEKSWLSGCVINMDTKFWTVQGMKLGLMVFIALISTGRIPRSLLR
jgi:uncharacterized protein YjbI with pentapeptide repeats